MPSERELFWTQSSFAVVGNSAKMNFPKLTYGGLKQLNKTVYPVDSSASQIEGDAAFKDFASLPAKVEAAVLEVPAEETAHWIELAARAGIQKVWLHRGTETPEALAVAKKCGITALSGTCAVMYVTKHFSPHAIHRCIMKLRKRY